MKIETILNAMQFAQTQSINLAMLERLDHYSANMILLGRRERQWLAFRARILRMFEELQECKHEYVRWIPFADGIYHLDCDICGEWIDGMESFAPPSFEIQRGFCKFLASVVH